MHIHSVLQCVHFNLLSVLVHTVGQV